MSIGEDLGDIAANESAGPGQADSHDRSVGVTRRVTRAPYPGPESSAACPPLTGPVICAVIQPP